MADYFERLGRGGSGEQELLDEFRMRQISREWSDERCIFILGRLLGYYTLELEPKAEDR